MEYREILHGSVAAVVFQNQENGYAVIRFAMEDGEVVTVVGVIPLVSLGERLTLTGKWTTHSAYGRQFEAEVLERLLPVTGEEMTAYLASGILKGVGGKTAQRMVQAFGSETFDVLENSPERLTELPGISQKKAQELSRSFQRQIGIRRLMEFLAEHGLAIEIALPLYRIFGEQAMEAVLENPYLLTEEEFGASFSQVDRFAIELGFLADDPRRVKAGILFELEHNLGNGHTFLPEDKLIPATKILLDLPEETVADGLKKLREQGRVIADTLQNRAILYLPLYYEAETYVASRIQKMTKVPAQTAPQLAREIDAIEKEKGLHYAPQQREAMAAAVENNIVLITGGPGTGKTTTLGGILRLFDRRGWKTLLAAPTGRAAKRLTELTGKEASTIHRLLEAQYSQETGKMEFFRNEDTPLKLDVLVIDETSMVDLLLMQAILRALPEKSKLILVGDPDQLPSVGAGNFFSDLLRSEIAPAVRLCEIFRQARQSLIVMNAHAVNGGVMPQLNVVDKDFFFLRRNQGQAVVKTIQELCQARLPQHMGIESWDIQVLSPSRKFETGTYALNLALQAVLNPPISGKREKQFGDFVFREGDRVMQTRNNYDILWKKVDGTSSGAGIFNGDIGKIEQIDFGKEQIRIVFDDREAAYDFAMLSELELAYAMTVHKSQGSEYRAVVMAAYQGSERLLTRNVLYTAITRAKELFILVGKEEIIAAMIANNRQQKRYSGLKLRLGQKITDEG